MMQPSDLLAEEGETEFLGYVCCDFDFSNPKLCEKGRTMGVGLLLYVEANITYVLEHYMCGESFHQRLRNPPV